MTLKLYQIDAFTNSLFHGNPAAICPLEEWLPDDVMQNIAAENNLSETGFFIKRQDHFEIRWFTPVAEVDLCGHATLAAAFVIFNIQHDDQPRIRFTSRSGSLFVSRQEDWLVLDFPAGNISQIDIPDAVFAGTGIHPVEAYRGSTDYMFVYSSQEDIVNIKPVFPVLEQLDCRGIIVTAKGNGCDFVSRFFGPKVGVPEDPVTGSAHTMLIPYWARVLGKNDLTAMQLSKRTGELRCKLSGERVEIAGRGKLYLTGEITVS